MPKPDRITVPLYSRDPNQSSPGLYGHMFVEDISNGIVPYRWNSDDEEHQTAHVDGDEDAKSLVKIVCTSLAGYRERDVNETILRAVNAIVSQIAWSGRSTYEICGSAKDIALVGIIPYRLFRIPLGFVRLIPKRDQEYFEGKRYTFLRANRSWSISVPRELGGARGHRKLLRRLRVLSSPAPMFWTEELRAGNLASGFDFKVYSRWRDAQIALLTRKWGWNRRDSSINNTEFFYFYRSLRFRRSLAILRNHVVKELNQLLSREGVKATIRLEGFRTPAEIDELTRKACDGSIHYAEAFRLAR
jgi:hypothetical protein